VGKAQEFNWNSLLDVLPWAAGLYKQAPLRVTQKILTVLRVAVRLCCVAQIILIIVFDDQNGQGYCK
jgi:hypothetical protein